MCPSREDAQQERRQLELLTNAKIAGLLVSLASGTHELSHLEALRADDLPLVFFDRAAVGFTGRRISSVVLDDYERGTR